MKFLIYFGGLLSNLTRSSGFFVIGTAFVFLFINCCVNCLRANDSFTNARHLEKYFDARVFRS